MKVPGRILLLVAAGCSGFVAVLHVSIAIAGPEWYRYFGAPSLAAKIEAGAPLVPTMLALAVAAVFILWACYALSGAGAIRPLPLLRTALFVIAGVYLLRGLQVVPESVAVARGAVPGRYPVFSAFSAFAGVAYLLGVLRLGRSGRTPHAHAA
jgi:putative oxidoreductase